MAFEVRNYTTTCPAELIEAINNGSPNIGPTLIQIIQGLTFGEVFEITGETGGGSPSVAVFEFTSALSTGEELIFDNILATFVCPVDDTNLVDEQDFSDDHGPDENVIWSSEKITNDFVNVPGDTMTGTLTLSSGNINVNTGGLRVGHTFTSGHTLSVQSNTAATYIEILNNAGTNKGAFFGVENYLTPNDFALYNWQGGPITFYTDTTASSENRRMVIQPDGDVEIKNLTVGFVKSAADGTLSSGVISESDISDLGNYAVIGGAHHDTFSDFVANEHINHTNVTLTAGAGLSGGGNITTNRTFSVNVQNSIEIATDSLQLVGDSTSPGNNKLYGTNGSGTKGWYDQPSGSGQGSPAILFPEYFDAYHSPVDHVHIDDGWTDVSLNVEREKTDAFSHTTDSAEITINKTDKYVIMFHVSTDVETGSARSDSSARLAIDTGAGYNAVSGSYVYMYNRQATRGENTGAGSVILNLNVGDKIKLQAYRHLGTDLVILISGGCGMTIFSATNQGLPGSDGVDGVDGVDGQPGPPGSGSNIVVQDNGSSVPGTPHTILNFIGATITNQGGSPNPTVDIECGGGGLGGPKEFFADQVEYCSGSNWSVTSGAPACVDSLNNALTVRRFDDTTDEAIGFMLSVPVGASSVTFQNITRAQTAPTSSKTACHGLKFRHISHNSNPSTWNTYLLPNITIPNNTTWQIVTTSTLSLGTVGLDAGKTYQFQYYRNASNPSDDLSGDMTWLRIGVEFS